MTDWSPALVAAGLGTLVGGGLLALALARRPAAARTVGYGAGMAGGVITAAAGIVGLAGEEWRATVPWLLLPSGAELALDRLSAFFLLLIGGIAVPASLYALGYTRGHEGSGVGTVVAYDGFLAAMIVVALGANVVTFLVAWELQAVASYFLVMAEPDARGVARAGWVYALVTHAGLGCLLAAMLLLVQATGSDRFADWSAATPLLDPVTASVAFLLFALGFGAKAGMVPVHVWLPLAHPVAPSHVSALMSGVMIKLGVYGLLRVGFEWLPDGPVWWGAIVLLLGAASALLGVLYALVDPDLKRLLAYSSVENVGLILLGVGAALVFRSAGADALALLGLVAALYHVAGHACFKALLFLGAGAVLHATGGTHLETLGGLIKRMPQTAACFLVGAVSIAALPPLAGFVSEWLLFQALVQSFRVPRPGLNLVFLSGLGALALTGGLAVACFVRAFGIGFLALPRSDAAAAAHEVPGSMLGGMYLLVLACVGLGVLPTVVVPRLVAAVPGAGTPGAETMLGVDGATLAVGAGFSGVAPAVVAALLIVAASAVLIGLRAAGARRDVRAYETWGCGRSLQTARMEYTATAFSQPFKRIFAVLYRPVKQLDIEFHADSRFFVRTIRYENPTRSLIEEWLYIPALTGTRRLARVLQRIQSGSANLYLAYIVAVLLLLLLGWVR